MIAAFKLVNKKLSAFLVAVLILSSFSACGAKNSVIAAIEANNADKAREIYQDQYADDEEKSKEITDELLSRLAKAYDDYNNGKESYDEAYRFVQTVESTRIIDHSLIEMRYHMLERLKASKDAYAEAESLYDQSKWVECCEQCENVSEEDTNHSAAVAMADKAKAGYFDELFQKADAYVAKEDLKAAYQTLKEIDSRFEDDKIYLAKLNEVETKFAEQVIADAKTAFGEKKDYEAAIRILQASGLTTAAVTNEIQRYQSYAPVDLYTLEYTKKGEYMNVGYYITKENKTDVNNHTYLAESVIQPGGGSLPTEVPSTEDEASVTYYLNAGYSRLTGTVYRPYSSLHCEYTWGTTGIVYIYGDGVRLYSSPDITQKTYEEYQVDVDVTGVRELKIIVFGSWHEDDGWGGVNYNPKACLADVKLYK